MKESTKRYIISLVCRELDKYNQVRPPRVTWYGSGFPDGGMSILGNPFDYECAHKHVGTLCDILKSVEIGKAPRGFARPISGYEIPASPFGFYNRTLIRLKAGRRTVYTFYR